MFGESRNEEERILLTEHGNLFSVKKSSSVNHGISISLTYAWFY